MIDWQILGSVIADAIGAAIAAIGFAVISNRPAGPFCMQHYWRP